MNSPVSGYYASITRHAGLDKKERALYARELNWKLNILYHCVELIVGACIPLESAQRGRQAIVDLQKIIFPHIHKEKQRIAAREMEELKKELEEPVIVSKSVTSDGPSISLWGDILSKDDDSKNS